VPFAEVIEDDHFLAFFDERTDRMGPYISRTTRDKK
jgi:hypothetical protein